MIIGLIGLEGSGKDTAARYLVEEHGFIQRSLAAPLKDVVSAVFLWPRDLLEGNTAESRRWRETTDEWWSRKLDIPNFTPRMALRLIGTEVFRNHFSDSIWILSMEKFLASCTGNVVVSDVRFYNEIEAIRAVGSVYHIRRGPYPEWVNTARELKEICRIDDMHTLRPDIHQSNWDWIRHSDFPVIMNDGTLSELHQAIESTLRINM